MSEYEEREEKRNALGRTTPEEQLESAITRWEDIWIRCQTVGREEELAKYFSPEHTRIQFGPGAIPREEWKNFVKNESGYNVEGVLQIMEQIAVNGDIHKALEIFDELTLSIDEYDEVAKAVLKHMPELPNPLGGPAPNVEERRLAKFEFSERANKSAHSERAFLAKNDNSWLKKLDPQEYKNREEKRNALGRTTPEEQLESAITRWEDIWIRCQTVGREEELAKYFFPEHTRIQFGPGAIPREEWKNFVKNESGYNVEGVLQIMEQIAVNGDIHKALEIFDELTLSIDEYDEVAKTVLKHMPELPNPLGEPAPNVEERRLAKFEFTERATEPARHERYIYIHSREEKEPHITIKDATKNAILSGISTDDIRNLSKEEEKVEQEKIEGDFTNEQ